MYLTRILAEHVCTIAARPPLSETRDMTIRCVLDLVGAAIAGHSSTSAVAARQSVAALFGAGEAPIWSAGRRSSVIGAIMCNATAASALDVDDGHRSARGHPGAAVITTALTLGSACHADGDDIIAAIVAGYDIGVRVAAAQNPAGIPTRQSGRWAGIASAATAAVLLKAAPPVISQAMSIAGVLAPNQQANGSSGYSRLTGNHVKEGIAWSTATGLMALELAIHGHTGPEDLFDHPDFYDRQRLLSDLGQRWEILTTYIKPYACCRYIHPALDRLLELVDRYCLNAETIVSIEVQTFGWALKLANRTNPDTLVDVQYSLPYCLAIALVDGAAALLPVTTNCLDRPDLIAVANKVQLSLHHDSDRIFPEETLARVVVHTRRGRFASDLGGPLGDPRSPLLWHGIEEKFRRLTSGELTPTRQQAVIDAALALADGNAKPLFAEISRGPVLLND
ncbi:MmgE/PrpD family protein [Rhizobium mesoamericanum]|uniref:MmgE/PrpD family protein n=1 Tax=Rhizobium mesoamericanum TaxID=1079800 RepID=UPI0027D8180D|nr:MmgE/PrpD family protein [Rhizobium mesoamericanum]